MHPPEQLKHISRTRDSTTPEERIASQLKLQLVPRRQGHDLKPRHRPSDPGKCQGSVQVLRFTGFPQPGD